MNLVILYLSEFWIGTYILLIKAFDSLNFHRENKIIQGNELAQINPQEQMKIIAENYLDKMYRYVRYTFSLQGSTAEDIVHDLFLYLPKKIKKFDYERNFEPRLYRVTHNHAINWIKKQKNISNKEENTIEEEVFIKKIQSHQGEMTDEIEQAYKDSLLKVALNKLSEKNRNLLILYYFEYKSYEDIAEIIKVKASGIGTMLARAKKELRKKIKTTPELEQGLFYDLD